MNVFDKIAHDGKVSRPRRTPVLKNGTKPARTREGAKFPGGKHMRRALAILSARQNAYAPFSKPSGHAQTKPGSLKA